MYIEGASLTCFGTIVPSSGRMPSTYVYN